LEGKTPNLFKSLKERESDPPSPEHLVYHYGLNENQSQYDSSLSNTYLINLIDNFSSLQKTDFYNDCFEKIKYLLAVRVWLEKKLYNLIPSVDSVRKTDFLTKDQTIQHKINNLKNVGKYGSDLFAVNNVTLETITCKKVMLNQNLHYYSQVQPFAYAMNISLDDLSEEINELKALF